MYFGESKHTGLRKGATPDPASVQQAELAAQNVLLRKLLKQQAHEAEELRSHSRTSVARRTINSNFRAIYVLALLAIVAAVVAGGAWYTTHYLRATGIIPAKYSSGLGYPLYYPTNLPSGYRVDPASFKRQGDVLVFSIVAPTGKNIAVSEEAIPKNLNLTQNQNPSGLALPDQRNFNTAIGTAQISLWGDKFVSSVVTGKTWIVLNVSGFKLDDAQKVTQAFTEVN